ncbi:MAG: metal-dependent transcriptional regulator [Prolixibacteraceae bacterium]|nr:metal-dependent transcriptional regulator [Prolixibacteraceae bacterium]
MASQTEENYLKSLFALSRSPKGVNVSELSTLLQVSLPTVNSMVKNLKKQGLVNYEKYKPISLTGKGKKAAALVLRKHRLTEMFLVEKMGFGWEVVHDIAEQVEHIDSPEFFDRMDKLLGFPKFDPHGSPIPDKNGAIAHEIKTRLSDCKPGDRVKIAAISQDSSDFIRFLNNNELHLGTEISINSIESFDKSMIVTYKDHASKMLSKEVCDRLLVEQL